MVSKQKGVALLQVLLLTAILTLMALYFVAVAKSNVNKSIEMGNVAAAELKLQTVQSELLFELLTQQTNALLAQEPQKRTFSSRWNFYAKPFEPEPGVTVELQDVNGLVSVISSANLMPFKQLLRYFKVSPTNESGIINELLQWQSPHPGAGAVSQPEFRHDAMAGIEDILKFESVGDELGNKLLPLIYPWEKSLFNPLVAPDTILRATYGDEMAAQLTKLREEGLLNARRFTELTGLSDDDEFIFQVGRRFRVKITVSVGGAVVMYSGFWYIRPENDAPVIFLN
ncbi:hypothetical protein [Shewanella sp. FJAT-52076]|uniref:hypothetical protein n=1 Tax=Shewanella sp. FJAT-52076 TaxID=2864202 RepID=UPI001C6565BE|nr:hypothetical protein [Shewanella sp. FJAT-52076]QYJ74053.1 hypothetical protein K0H79_11760 [Shewanella sp. FJAT-52076]